MESTENSDNANAPKQSPDGDLPLPEGDSPFGATPLTANPTPEADKAATPQSGSAGDDDSKLPPPPGIGRLTLQLFLIPALICGTAIGSMLLIYKLMHRSDSLETVMLRLRMTSGAGTLAVGINDPRYQDRCRAAMTLAEKLPQIEKDGQADEVGNQLVEILKSSVSMEETQLRIYLVLAIGRLGPKEGFPLLLEQLSITDKKLQQAAVTAIAALPSHQRQRSWDALNIMRLELEKAVARGETDPLDTSLACELVRVMGILIGPDQLAAGNLKQENPALWQRSVDSLKAVFRNKEDAHRDVIWNAAIALARVSDPEASSFVADLLLNREALSQIEIDTGRQFVDSQGETKPRTVKMPETLQTQIIASVLTAAAEPRQNENSVNSPKSEQTEAKDSAVSWRVNMTSQEIWDKIAFLAENDSNRYIKVRAEQLLQAKETSE